MAKKIRTYVICWPDHTYSIAMASCVEHVLDNADSEADPADASVFEVVPKAYAGTHEAYFAIPETKAWEEEYELPFCMDIGDIVPRRIHGRVLEAWNKQQEQMKQAERDVDSAIKSADLGTNAAG